MGRHACLLLGLSSRCRRGAPVCMVCSGGPSWARTTVCMLPVRLQSLPTLWRAGPILRPPLVHALSQLTTAERRRLAHRIKLLVRDSVYERYRQHLSDAVTIRTRAAQAAMPAEAAAAAHLAQLATERLREMTQLSLYARQQAAALRPPWPTDGSGENSSCCGAVLPSSSTGAGSMTSLRPPPHVVISMPPSVRRARRIHSDCGSGSGAGAGDVMELRTPLLGPAGDGAAMQASAVDVDVQVKMPEL